MQSKEKLILKLFSKACSRAELKLLLELIREDHSATPPKVMDELFQQIKDSEIVSEETFDSVWQKVTDQTADLPQKSIRPRPLWRQNRFFLKIAATVALVLVSLFVVQYFQSEDWVVQQSIAGQIKTVTLPDGSVVTLNGNSSIRYLQNWSADPIRTVHLQGEAYFKVKNFGDGTTKFHVVTPDLTVEVLGTSFNVISWAEETSVFLEEGQVNVKLDNLTDQEVKLEPGEVMQYSSKEQKLVPPKMVANQLEVSWKQGVLEFEETSLEDILHRLTSPNDLSYTIIDEVLAKREFTLRIPTEDLNIALDLLSTLTGINIEQIGHQLMIEEKTTDKDEKE